MSEAPLSLVDVLVRQREAWARGDRPAVEAVLDLHPHLAGDDEAVLDLIYNETLLREQYGPPAGLEEFVRRFPRLEPALRVQFELDEALSDEQLGAGATPLGSTVQLATPRLAALPGLEGCDVVDEIGRGAMGVVYRAWQRGARRVVAVKLLSGDMPAARMRTEVEAAARLQHPHIVQVFEVRQEHGRTALVLEYVEGGTLAQKLAGRPQPAAVAARLVETLAWAMAYAHGRGVIHRDLKPSNVLLAGSEQTPLAQCAPKIGDFGLARLAEGGDGLTRTTDVLGTPSYMAPEQTGGAADKAGPAADVYALGAILYECLTGRPPFLGQSVLDTLEQVRVREPVPPRQMQPGVPRDLETICLKCLRKQPPRRYAGARELAEDLRRYQAGEPIKGRPVGVAERLWKWGWRHPSAAALVLVIAAAVGLLVAGGVRLNAALRRERDAAQQHADQLNDQLRRTRRLLYTAQLLRVGSVWESNPAQGLRILEDPRACPPDLRCFSWGVLHGQCRRHRREIGPHTDAVTAVACHPDGTRIASGCRDGTVRLWGADGEPVTLPTHQGAVTALAFTVGGDVLATGGADGKVHLWDVAARQRRWTPDVPPGGVAALAFAANGRVLAVNSGPRGGAGRVTLWDTQTQRRRRTIGEATDPRSGLALSPDGHTVACASRDRWVRLWDTRTGTPRGTLRGHTAPVRALVFDPSGRLLASGSLDATVHLWDVTRDTTRGLAPRDTLEVATGPVAGLAFHPAGQTLAVVGPGAEGDETAADVQLWDVVAQEGGEPLRAHQGATGVAFTPDGTALVTGGADRMLKVWDHPGRPQAVRLRDHRPGPGSLTLAHNGRSLAWIARSDQPGGADELRVHDLSPGGQRTALPGQGRRLRRVALSPDGATLAAASGRDGEPAELLLWEVATGRLVQAISAPGTDINALAFAPDGRALAWGRRDGEVRLWDVAADKLRWQRSCSGPVGMLAFSGDGRTIAAAAAGAVVVWDASGEVRRHVETAGRPTCLTLDADGATLAYATVGDVVRLIGVVDGGERGTAVMGMKAIVSVAFSPDGQTLAAAGSASAVQLWDVPGLQQRASLPGHRGGACFAGFAADGSLLVTASVTQSARLWHRTRTPAAGAR